MGYIVKGLKSLVGIAKPVMLTWLIKTVATTASRKLSQQQIGKMKQQLINCSAEKFGEFVTVYFQQAGATDYQQTVSEFGVVAQGRLDNQEFVAHFNRAKHMVDDSELTEYITSVDGKALIVVSITGFSDSTAQVIHKHSSSLIALIDCEQLAIQMNELGIRAQN